MVNEGMDVVKYAVGESQLSRTNCETFSYGFNSWHFGGSGTMEASCGMTSLHERCHPA